MPNYCFKNPETGEIKEVFFHMLDNKVYEEDGVKWERVFTIPAASVDGKINAFSKSEFVQKTANKKMTVGDYWEKSQELSAKREQIAGKDEVKESFFDNYRKTHHGVDHPIKAKEKVKENLAAKGITLED